MYQELKTKKRGQKLIKKLEEAKELSKYIINVTYTYNPMLYSYA